MNFRKILRYAVGHTGTFTATGATPVVISNTNVTANSIISISLRTAAGTPAPVFFVSVTPGTGFSVNSTAGNTGVYNYAIEPV